MSQDHIYLARLEKGGKRFEIIIDPDKAVAFREGKNVPVEEVLMYDEIFYDAKKGERASMEVVKSILGTDDVYEAAKIILQEGEIQLSAEYREKLREEKKRQIIELIHRHAIDPRTNLPIPPQRIEAAMEHAHVKIDYFKSPEEQFKKIIDQLTSVLPIKIARSKLKITVPANYAGKLYGYIHSLGKVSNEAWLDDGSYYCELEIPAGLKDEVIDALNSKTHGDISVAIEDLD